MFKWGLLTHLVVAQVTGFFCIYHCLIFSYLQHDLSNFLRWWIKMITSIELFFNTYLFLAWDSRYITGKWRETQQIRRHIDWVFLIWKMNHSGQTYRDKEGPLCLSRSHAPYFIRNLKEKDINAVQGEVALAGIRLRMGGAGSVVGRRRAIEIVKWPGLWMMTWSPCHCTVQKVSIKGEWTATNGIYTEGRK